MACFFSEKILVWPRGVEIPSPLDQISLTPNTKGFQLYFHPRAPPSWSKQAKRLIFGTLTESHLRDHLQVTGHREKFYIGFFAQIFFGGQYICGEARKKFWHKKSMKNFSRSTHTWRVPESDGLFGFFHFLTFGLFWARNYDLNFLKKKSFKFR